MTELTKELIFELYKTIDREKKKLKDLSNEIYDAQKLKEAKKEQIEYIRFLESRENLIRQNTEYFEKLSRKQ